MSYSDAIKVVEEMGAEAAKQANYMALAATPGAFDKTGASTGVGIRLQALQDVKNALVTAGIKAHEVAAAGQERAS